MGNKPPPACVGLIVTRPCDMTCPSGQRRAGESCWEDPVTRCEGGFTTRDAPRTCPDGTEFDAVKVLCFPKCRNGYHKNPGDIVSCWNDKPLSKLITGTKAPTITF